MSVDSIRKKGYLYKRPVKGFVKKWSRRWFVLHGTTRGGVVRIEYYDNEGCEITGEGKRTIPLRDCSSLSEVVGSKVHPYVFQFKTPIGQHVFASDSQVDLEEWTDAIQEAVTEDRRLRKSQKKKGASQHSSSSGRAEQKKYIITLEENETTNEMGLQGKFHLDIGPSTLTLLNFQTGAQIASWHYKHLKNFGKQSGQFYFEIGALPGVSTKPGNFVCNTTSSKEIFSTINNNIKKLRENASRKPPTARGQPSQPNPPSQTTQTKPQVKQNMPTQKTETLPPGPIKTAPTSTSENKQISAQSASTDTSNSKDEPPRRYSVMAAGGRTAGRTGSAKQGSATGQHGYPQVHEDGFICEDDDGFSYDSFDSFDSFDDDEAEQPMSEVVNPLTANTQSEGVDFAQPVENQVEGQVEGQVEEHFVSEPDPQTSNVTTKEPTTIEPSTIATEAIDKAFSPQSVAASNTTDTTTNPPLASRDGPLPTEPPPPPADQNDPLATELDNLQNELANFGLEAPLQNELANFGLEAPLQNELANFGIEAPLQNELANFGTEASNNSGTALNMGQEAAIDDIANFDLTALLDTTGLPSEPLVIGEFNPDAFVNLDLGAMSPDFLQPFEPTMDIDAFSTEINKP